MPLLFSCGTLHRIADPAFVAASGKKIMPSSASPATTTAG
jgi:hypothetical protein